MTSMGTQLYVVVMGLFVGENNYHFLFQLRDPHPWIETVPDRLEFEELVAEPLEASPLLNERASALRRPRATRNCHLYAVLSCTSMLFSSYQLG